MNSCPRDLTSFFAVSSRNTYGFNCVVTTPAFNVFSDMDVSGIYKPISHAFLGQTITAIQRNWNFSGPWTYYLQITFSGELSGTPATINVVTPTGSGTLSRLGVGYYKMTGATTPNLPAGKCFVRLST